MVSKTKSSIYSREEAVARIAYQCSDVVFTIQPNFTNSGGFSPTLDHLYSLKTPNLLKAEIPQVIPLRSNADPFYSPLSAARQGQAVSVTTTSEPLLLAIPHLSKLSAYPIVIHVLLPRAPLPDFSTITAIRQTGFAILQSTSLQEVQDIAIASHSLALATGQGVIHFSEMSQDDIPIPQESPEVVRSLLTIRNSSVVGDSTTDSLVSRYRRDLEDQLPAPSETATAPDTASSSAKSDLSGEQEGQNGIKMSEANANGDGNGVYHNTPSPTNGINGVSEKSATKATSDVATEILHHLSEATGRSYCAFEYVGPRDAQSAVVVFGSHSNDFRATLEDVQPTEPHYGMGLILIRLYRPWVSLAFSDMLPETVKTIAVVEQLRYRPTKWGPIFLDVLASCRGHAESRIKVVAYQLGQLSSDSVTVALKNVAINLQSESPQQNTVIGQPFTPREESSLEQPHLETAYVKMLSQLFGQKLNVLNANDTIDSTISSQISSAPEYILGAYFARLDKRRTLLSEVSLATREGKLWNEELNGLMLRWITELSQATPLDESPMVEIINQLRRQPDALSKALISDPWLFKGEVPWIIGSEAWAFDLGSSGVHHLLASGKNVNMLIIDSQPYSQKDQSLENRKKDIGLYAMNFGNAYVASVAVYSSYTQVMHAMVEAQQFDGPSVVLAYLPYTSELDSPLQLLQETKIAVDSGYWPLYRWSPASEPSSEPVFQLDSERVKKELKAFIDRENHLTHLVKSTAAISTTVSHSHGSELRHLKKIKAKEAIEKLMDGLSGPPVTILFASDGGNAENVAKRIGRRGKARGLKPKILAMDDFPIEDLANEKNLIFCTSTAGQGEFPQNGREMWDTIKNSTDLDLSGINYTVFALGDSHYWPRKEDKLYYNKPGKDLDARLEVLGANRLVPVGLGDDQDPDGFETGYNLWEPQLWSALGADQVDADFEEPKPLTNEDIKIASNFLRGTIAEGLADTSTGAITESDAQLTKFHGTYMQDDRDLRDERKAQGLEPAYSFMVRVRMSGGVCQPEQWIAMDTISDQWGNQTFKLTTRQTFQFHGILKHNLRTAIRGINTALLTTIGACGDVNRNVMCSSLPTKSKLHAEVYEASKAISTRLLPSTSAYHEIWLQDSEGKKTQVAGDAVQDFEPLYGPTYLPRKFKITIAVPPVNDTDVYAHDIGLIAIENESSGGLDGFNVLIGGGMGMTHGSKKTYARLGQLFGFCAPREVSEVAEAIMLVQRDNGDRTNRKHARLKYTIDDMGLDEFKRQVEERLGRAISEPRKHLPFTKNIDDFSGWVKGDDGLYSHTIFIENGRVENTTELQAKAGLLEIAQYMIKTKSGHLRLTGNQHVIIAGITPEQLAPVKELLAKYKLDNLNFSGLRLSSSACVAFPTCGLAMAESERYLPTLITKLEDTLAEAGLRHSSIVMRMTGCPNGCARPWVAELACVGKAPGTYNLMLGGGYHGERLNKLYRPSVNESEILEILKPMIKRYALERNADEHFGDWVIRAGYITAVERGGQHGAMHEGVPDEED